MRNIPYSLALFGSLALAGCSGGGGGFDGDPTPRDYSSQFAPLPAPMHPADNPYSDAKAQLGELLFWDPILSGNQDVACATCHHPDFAWADGRPTSVGVGGLGLGPDRIGEASTPFHAPSVLNMAFTGLQMETDHDSFISGGYFWDLRADTLEAQALVPILSEVEMRGSTIAEDTILGVLVDRLKANNEYQRLFSQAFGTAASMPDEVITADNLAKALATYQRTLVSANSRFDQFLAGDSEALTEGEIIGLNAFIDNGCADCHNGPMLSDNEIDEEDLVLRHLAPVRTPSLRNVSKTAPYFQDGSRATLGSAINVYEDRGDLGVVSDNAFGAIHTFLLTLDSDFSTEIPDSVPSGLPVGGDL